MGLNLEISLDKDIRQINQFMTDIKFKGVVKSARQALNRTAKTTQSMAIKEIRKRRKLKLEDIKGSKKKGKGGFVTTRQAKGNNITALESKVNFSGVSLPMILFIVGRNTPKAQTVPNARRKTRSFEIQRGRKSAKKGLFVQKAKSGGRKYQVFRRGDPSDKSKGFRMQSAPSIAEYLRSKQNIYRKIENHALATLSKTYERALAHNLRGIRL